MLPMTVFANPFDTMTGSNQQDDTDPSPGTDDSGDKWIAAPGVWVSAILIDANTGEEAATYIKNNVGSQVPSFYDAAPSGAFYTAASGITGPLSGGSTELTRILNSFCGHGNTTAYWRDSAYEPYWHELLAKLQASGNCSAAAWNHYQTYGTVDGTGKKVVIVFELGYIAYYQDSNNVNQLANAVYGTYGSIIGSNYFTPFSDSTAIKGTLVNDSSISLRNNISAEFPFMAFGVTEYKNGSRVIGGSSPWGGEKMYTNFITGPGGNYYGRGYWIPGQGEPVVQGLNMQFEVYGDPQGARGQLGDGSAEKGHFIFRFTSDEVTINNIRNSPGYYKVTITPRAVTPTSTKPDTISSSPATWGTIGAAPVGEFQLITRTGNRAQDITFNNSTGKFTFNMSADGMANLLEGQYEAMMQCWVKDPVSATTREELAYNRAFDITVEHKAGGSIDYGVTTVMPTDIPNYGTNHEFVHGQYNADTVWWTYSEGPDPIPWEFHSDTNAVGYAEVVGNQAGYLTSSGKGNVDRYAQDWNVNAGIPSTENLSVVAGGQTYLFDLAGLIQPKGINHAGPVDNVNKGTYAGGAVERDIKFNVIVEDWWGATNTPCSLSCTGHSNSASNTVSATGENDSATCDWCGTVIKGTTTPAVYDPITGAQISPAVDNTVPHTCTVTINFDCSTGTWTASGNTSGTTGTTSTLSSDNQQYYGSGSAKDAKGTSRVSLTVSHTPLCDGYTTGKGCTHSNNTNCAHRTTRTVTFTVKETLDCYAYRTITQARILALSDAEITAVDTNIVDASAIGRRVSNSNLYMFLWRADGGYVTSGGTGRLWFTQFVSPNYNGGWRSTSCVNAITQDSTDVGYWLGNTEITIKVAADSTAAGTANPGAIDAAPALSEYRGKSLNHYGTVDSTSTSYKSNAGDMMSDDYCVYLAQHVVNAWQNANNVSSYTINVISDNLAAGISTGTVSATGSTQNTFQNIVGDIYSVDGGIALFNYGFQGESEVHYRNHVNDYNIETLMSLISANVFSVRDVTESKYSVMQAGYIGLPSDNPLIKYGASATVYNGQTVQAMQQAGTMLMNPVVRERVNTLAGFLEYTCEGNTNQGTDNATSPGGSGWTAGSLQYTTSGVPYAMPVDQNFKAWNGAKVDAGQTFIDQVTVGTMRDQTFKGYYNTHTYPYIQSSSGSLYTEARVNQATDSALYKINVTDNGNNASCFSYRANGFDNYYNAALVISNIDMKDTAHNGKYDEPVTVKVNYRQMFRLQTNDSVKGLVTDSRGTPSFKAVYKAGDVGVNSIIIHNPVSVEYCEIIGNGSGSYASGVEDETGQDMRIIYDPSTPEGDKPNYIVMGNTFHLWFSDFGDFYDDNASWAITSPSDLRGVGSIANACSDTTGKINLTGSISSAEGYANNMLCSTWTKERQVKFSFPVSYVNTSNKTVLVPAGQTVNLADVRCLKADGTYGTTSVQNMHAPSNALLDFAQKCPTLDPDDIKYGLDYEFTCLTSAFESTKAKVYVQSIANNAPSNFNNIEPTNKLRGGYSSEHNAFATYEVQLVGRIGNLALEDVGDFRFSNLFKKANSSWLIQNIIHDVDIDTPNCILSTKYDLLLNNASLNGINHNTTSINTVSKGNQAFLGKGGPWLSLPLTASLNNVEEFKQEQMRLGYMAYFDIETMGNYYGVNVDDAGIPDLGPQSANDTIDNRAYKLVITPRYILYDYENGTYHDIDMYSGRQGAYEMFWSDGLALTKPVSSIYIDVGSNKERWNVGSYEPDVTTNVIDNSPSAFSGEDYIGTATQIVLDQADRSYIGSSALYGSLTKQNNMLKIVASSRTVYLFDFQGNQYDGDYKAYPSMSNEGINEKQFAQQVQRWYFAMGVPSSTYIVPAGTDSSSQAKIEQGHEQLKAAHPHSVILCYATIDAYGTVWDLRYDFSQENGTTSIVLFNTVDDIPSDVPNPGSITKVINPPANPTSGIKDYMAPLLVMDAWNTSADDWDTYGTH